MRIFARLLVALTLVLAVGGGVGPLAGPVDAPEAPGPLALGPALEPSGLALGPALEPHGLAPGPALGPALEPNGLQAA
jgi:hypothetical protein